MDHPKFASKCLKCGKWDDTGRILKYRGFLCRECEKPLTSQINAAYDQIYSGLWGYPLIKQVALAEWAKLGFPRKEALA